MWLISWKSATGKPAVGYDEAVEEALCFGWVDSLQRSIDDERSIQRFSPRKPKSRWSRSNKERVERLTAEGLMAPAGLAAIENAKETGAWTELDAVEEMIVPDDLAAAFTEHPGSREHWDDFPDGVKKRILLWLLDAKRPETRAKRTAEAASEAAAGRRANE